MFGNHKDYEDKNSFNIVSSENENKVQNVKIASYVDNEEGNDTNLTELMERISEMTERKEDFYICKFCQKQARNKNHIGKHIESHIDGITLTCEYCNKKFRSRESIRMHKMRAHPIYKAICNVM